MATLSLDELNNYSRDHLPEWVGYEVTFAEPGLLRARMTVQQKLLAPNGYLHAASVIALADSACGYGTRFDLPETAKGFTTIELKCNFLGTVREGELTCEARRMHRGRTTQVWDAEVHSTVTGKNIALFRCTQMIFEVSR
ncbi:MAG TPA: PaaI family thioesterase [Bryobacteraceae bacterium]|nr:PaaI family thioesterase [Bryobacteraceae bacterium]